MKVIDRFNVSKPPEGPKKYTFEFTGHGLVSLLVLAVFGIAWIFFLGVLLGRGNKPENAVPQLAKIMPTPFASQQENADQPTVLKPEELQFQDTLQGRKPPETVTVDSTQKTAGAQASPQTPPQAPKGSAVQAPGAQSSADKQVAASSAPRQVAGQERPASAVPKGQVATAKAEPDKKAPAPVPEKKTAPGQDKQTGQAGQTKQNGVRNAAGGKPAQNAKGGAAAKEPAQSRVYQVAALDKEALAHAEAQNLRRKGFAATVEKSTADGKSVYRVLVRVKGTPAQIKQTLEKSGTKKPILRDKKSL